MRKWTLTFVIIVITSAAAHAGTWSTVQWVTLDRNTCNGGGPPLSDYPECTEALTQTLGAGHELTILFVNNSDPANVAGRSILYVYACAARGGVNNDCNSSNTTETFVLHHTLPNDNCASTVQVVSGGTTSADCATVKLTNGGANFITVGRTQNGKLETMGFAVLELALSGGTPSLDSVSSGVASTLTISPNITSTTVTGNDAIAQGISSQPQSVTSPYGTNSFFSAHFGYAYSLNTGNGAAPTWTNRLVYGASGTVVAWSDGGAPATFPLTITTTGSGTVTSSPAGISCPGTCTASFNNGVTVTLTATATSPFTFNTWAGDCAASGSTVTCPLVMSASHTASATFMAPSAVPILPHFVDNNELNCGFTAQCLANSPGLGYVFSPFYEYRLGTGWLGAAPPSCTFSGSYTVNAAGTQNFLNDLEKCRTAHAPGALIFDIPPGAYPIAGALIIPQTNLTGVHATSPIIVRTSAYQSLESMPEPVGAGGIQANVLASAQPGLRNPSLDGANLQGLATECPTQSTATGGLAYQLGESTICIPAGNFTLANGLNPFVNAIGVPGCPTGAAQPSTACYNYLQFMPVFSETSNTAPFILCSVAPGALTAQTCNSTLTIPAFGPDLWEFEGIVFADAPGNVANINLVNASDNGGNSTSTAQWASHIHFRRDALLGDWANLSVGNSEIATALSLGSCDYCSFVGSSVTQVLRPGAEGHIGGLSGIFLKISNVWGEGESSCFFTGGGASAPTILPIGSFVNAQDIQQTRVRCTFPLAWLGSICGPGNVPNTNIYWGGAGDCTGSPTVVNVDATGLIITYVSGPAFHDSTSFWPGNNAFVNGTGTPNKYKIVGASSWPQKCGTFCFPSNPPTQLTLQSAVTGAPLTNVSFIVNGASIVRKNCDEKKTGVRYLKAGGIDENVDPSGGQSGICDAYSNRNTSGGGQGTNYQNTLQDFNVQNMIIQNTCEDLSMDARSAPGSGNGGGVTTPMQRMSFYNVAHLNITSTNPGCAVTGATVGMQVNVGNEAWTGTVTENGAGTSATFVATASVDAAAPLESDTITGSSYSNPNLTLTAANTMIAGEFVAFPCAACAGATGNALLDNQAFQVASATSTTVTLTFGVGFSGTIAGSAKIQGPAGFQYLGIPDGFPVFLSGCVNTAFNSSTTGVGPIASVGGGSLAWTGVWIPQAVAYGTTGTTSVTFPLVTTASSSTTCKLSNIQGSPQNLYVQKNTFITDAASPFGSGTSPTGGAAYGLSWGFQDNLLLNSGAATGHAGWFNVAVSLGEGKVTEIFQADQTTLTASNLLIPRPTGAAALYAEFCNNTSVSVLNCTPASANPPHMFFPNASGAYASCAAGFVACNSYTGNVALALPDPHSYALAPSIGGVANPFVNAASDLSALGTDFTMIDAAETANTYVPMVMGKPVIVPVGPFPDSLALTPPPVQSPSAPAAKAFAMLEMGGDRVSYSGGGVAIPVRYDWVDDRVITLFSGGTH